MYKSQAQSFGISYGDGSLRRDYSGVGSYKQLRAVRKDPSVALGRELLASCILAGEWDIEGDEDISEDVLDFIGHILSLRRTVIENAVKFGKVDFGWMGFEKLYEYKDGRIICAGLKPLLHDITTIMVTPQGVFNGYKQTNGGDYVYLPPESCLHIAFDVEAGNLYGMPLLENIRQACDAYDECEDGASRYDKKLAGSHWVVKYPPGTGTLNGETVDNSVIAAEVLAGLKSSGSIYIPTTVADVLQEIVNAEVAELYKWSIELITDSGSKQSNFIDRLKYLDALKVRGLLLPERAILEGQFGTKAESAAQSEWAVLNMQGIDSLIAGAMNEQVINPLLVLNFGPEYINKVRIVSAPLEDLTLDFLRGIYTKLSDPNIDVDALRERLEIPTKEGGSALGGNESDSDTENTRVADERGESAVL